MGKRFYVVTRDLHLYLGLFLSPFVLVFAVSVFYLVHAPRAERAKDAPARLAGNLPVTEELERLTGREQIDALRPVLDRVGVRGEVGFVRKIAKDHRLVIQVAVPGRESTVDLDIANRTARISDRDTGFADALVYLHKMPGPHLVAIRVNTFFMRVWRMLADAVSYGLLFLTLTGVYLWTALRAERTTGLAFLALGAISFFGLVYAISH